MLKKLKNYFPTAIESTIPPGSTNNEFYWFEEKEADPHYWLGIPKDELQVGQLELLETLYHRVTLGHSSSFTGAAKEWHSFLFLQGDLPTVPIGHPIRFIQLQINQTDQEVKELELAVKEFFHTSLAFIWLEPGNAVIVEEMAKASYEENDFQSIASTLENEFFIKPFFYIGKFRSETERLREAFLQEQELFLHAMNRMKEERVFSFERIFPTLLAANLPSFQHRILAGDIVPIFKEDPELRQTMMTFLEQNSNTSHAAKKLYVHRNTLQYRIDKFSEKTSINLKDFPSAMTVYLACLLSLME